jgi:translation initiation factor IF-2
MSYYSGRENYIFWYLFVLAAVNILGYLDTLRHFKDSVKEVRKGTECGLSFAEFDDLRLGDLIQCYKEIEHKRKLYE